MLVEVVFEMGSVGKGRCSCRGLGKTAVPCKVVSPRPAPLTALSEPVPHAHPHPCNCQDFIRLLPSLLQAEALFPGTVGHLLEESYPGKGSLETSSNLVWEHMLQLCTGMRKQNDAGPACLHLSCPSLRIVLFILISTHNLYNLTFLPSVFI